LGRKLARRLEAEGHRTITLSRRASPATAADSHTVAWNPDGSAGDLPRHIDGADAIVNLAGEGMAEGRWTDQRKRQLRDSRILSTRTLARAIAACHRRPRVFVSGSGIGYYGPRGDEPVTEDTPAGDDFVAKLTVEWEQEARQAESLTRVALVRTAPALSGDGGMLEKLVLPFKLGLGATLGSGDQYLPWIHIDDWTAMVSWLIDDDRCAGAFNAAAPGAVTNRQFTRALGRVLGRPAVLRAPAFALRAAMGEMAAMLLTGQRALPACAEQLGFRFTHRALEPALESLNL
jgi:uncharacterized protein